MGVKVPKLIRIYSELGGAYSSGTVVGRKLFKNVAFLYILSIVATLSTKNMERNECLEEELKLVSGYMLRAPYHARRPTDRIMIITIEILIKSDKAFYFLNFINNCVVYVRARRLLCGHKTNLKHERRLHTPTMYLLPLLYSPL